MPEKKEEGKKDNSGFNQKQTHYIKAKKFSLEELISIIPKPLIPTKIFGYIFGGVFILAIIIAIFNFPVNALLSGSMDVSIDIGWPLPFFVLDFVDVEALPIRFGGLILDCFLYLVFAYFINVGITYLLTSGFFDELRGIKKTIKPYNLPVDNKKKLTQAQK